ncbi:MAPK-interacting and spindle-stabilizing protein-like [Harpegnathos saltator]|uniref:MAPK-interacting and spindle-stabilizing protein-like n=1 Tax=Harpegnathos saltator TaxID=610380 RepID=UPI000DBEDF9E|nr:MAPK-interacting and spindle-stabilizing protein-like [Harpegnathos saltator]
MTATVLSADTLRPRPAILPTVNSTWMVARTEALSTEGPAARIRDMHTLTPTPSIAAPSPQAGPAQLRDLLCPPMGGRTLAPTTPEPGPGGRVVVGTSHGASTSYIQEAEIQLGGPFREDLPSTVLPAGIPQPGLGVEIPAKENPTPPKAGEHTAEPVQPTEEGRDPPTRWKGFLGHHK